MDTEKRSLRARLDALPTWALVLLCLIYCISPIDLLPFIPVDDVVVFGWTLFTLVKRLSSRGGQSLPQSADRVPVLAHAAPDT
jgi:uncharacterized membrane protein YkvA (DUF1232 family)